MIIGHDLGPGVERVYGPGIDGYEFVRRLTVASVARLLQTLDAGSGDVLAVVATRFDSSYALERHLETHSIDTELEPGRQLTRGQLRSPKTPPDPSMNLVSWLTRPVAG